MRGALLSGLILLASFGCTGGGGSSSSRSTAVAPIGSSPPGPVSSGTAPLTSSGTAGTSTPPSSSGGAGGIPGVTPGTPSYGLALVAGDPNSLYDIYVPPTYTGAPIGLVVAFHGVEGSSTPDGWFSVCVQVCNQDRFIVVTPYGDVNDGGSGAWTQPYGREVMDLVRSSYNVDDKRQYVAAVSGGCLPAIYLALASGPATYQSQVGGFTTKMGYQADFAAVGFSSPAYSPSDGVFSFVTYDTAAQLGFTPGLWADYGSQSGDQPAADDLASWGTQQGYMPVKEVARPNEGHARNPPYTYEVQMFDLFAATSKP